MKNTNSTTTTTVNTLEALRKDCTCAMQAYDKAAADKSTITAAALNDAAAKVEKAINAYNAHVLETAYADCLDADNPIAAIARRHEWSKMRHSKKQGTSVMEGVSTRFNLLDFIAYTEKTSTPIPDAAVIKTQLSHVTDTISNYITRRLSDDETASIKVPADALEKLIRTIGIDGVHGRAKDIRFIQYAATRPGKLGELRTMKDKAVAPYIMDVFFTQLAGVPYKFEDKKAASNK